MRQLYSSKFLRNFASSGLISFSLLMFISLPAQSQGARIFLEGNFDDWEEVDTLHVDPGGDQLSGAVDFGGLWMANDDNFLFLSIEVGGELNFQDDNDIALFIDADYNAATGISVNGIGAEMEWDFGDKRGYFVAGTDFSTISQADIGIVSSPTVTSIRFEIKIDLDSHPNGVAPLFAGDSIRIVFQDRGDGQDMLPDSGSMVIYVIDYTPLPPLAPLPLQKRDSSHIRVLSYNVHLDDLFNPDLEDSYKRILNALQPEIIGFQEIYNHNAAQTAARVEQMLPSGGGQWYGEKVDPDIAAVSRYPILEVFPLDGNGAFLLDLQPAFDSHLLLIVAHTPSGGDNQGRQEEIDQMMAFVREAKEPGGVLTLKENTPIMLIGDFNLVGYAQQLETLLTGNIVNNAQYGPDFSPDWDGSDFADLTARHTDRPLYFTWCNESSSYSPGRLDFVIYSDYVMSIGSSFVLFTPDISPDTLALYNLKPGEATAASDHLPLVADIEILNGKNLKPVKTIK